MRLGLLKNRFLSSIFFFLFLKLENILFFVRVGQVAGSEAIGEVSAAPESTVFSVHEFHSRVAVGANWRLRGEVHVRLARGEFEVAFTGGFFSTHGALGRGCHHGFHSLRHSNLLS